MAATLASSAMLPNVERPLWRLFSASQMAAAIRHARRGGLSVITKRSWTLLAMGGADGEGDPPVMVEWAIQAIHCQYWMYDPSGPTKGLVRAPIPHRFREWAREWAERDAAFEGSTHRFALDCMTCAACCFDNKVILSTTDLHRWGMAERRDLFEKTKVWRKQRRLPLVPPADGCVHLDGLKCGIYEVRPDMCRDFVPATENCLAARERKYGKSFF
jgi:Fe-S-cluster containining protein